MAPYGNQSQAQPQVNPKKKEGSEKTLWEILTSKEVSPRRLSVPVKQQMVFFRQLAVIMQSGVPIAQGLVLLSDNMTNPQFSGCISTIAQRLSAGDQISTCLRMYPKVFKPITIGLIEAGEIGGILETVLDRIALLMEQQEKLKGQMIGALIYPVIVLVIAFGVGLGLLIGIVPRFAIMFNDLGAELPGITVFMLNLSALVTNPVVIGSIVVGVFVGLFLLNSSYKTKPGRLAIDGFLLKLPIFGPLLMKYEMANMSETLSTLVSSGIPVVDGLERCVNSSSNQVVKDALAVAIADVKRGQTISGSLSTRRAIPKMVSAMIRIGEETGRLPFLLEKLAVFYSREIESAVSALTKAMEPLIVLLVAVIVGTIVISLYLPMFDLIKAFKG